MSNEAVTSYQPVTNQLPGGSLKDSKALLSEKNITKFLGIAKPPSVTTVSLAPDPICTDIQDYKDFPAFLQANKDKTVIVQFYSRISNSTFDRLAENYNRLSENCTKSVTFCKVDVAGSDDSFIKKYFPGKDIMQTQAFAVFVNGRRRLLPVTKDEAGFGLYLNCAAQDPKFTEAFRAIKW